MLSLGETAIYIYMPHVPEKRAAKLTSSEQVTLRCLAALAAASLVTPSERFCVARLGMLGGAGRDKHYDEGRKEKKTSFAGAPGTCGVVLCPLIPEEASSQIELAPLPRKVRNTFC